MESFHSFKMTSSLDAKFVKEIVYFNKYHKNIELRFHMLVSGVLRLHFSVDPQLPISGFGVCATLCSIT